MRIPKSVKFGGLVIAVDDSFTEILSDKNEPLWGQSMPGGKIRLLSKTTLPPSHRAETFLHELIHQVDGNYHLELSEQATTLLAHGLFAIFVQNKLRFYE